MISCGALYNHTSHFAYVSRMMCTETAETAQRAKQRIESWLASSFATSGRWRPVVLLKDEMKYRGNLVATKKWTSATMKTDTVPPLSGPEFPSRVTQTEISATVAAKETLRNAASIRC